MQAGNDFLPNVPSVDIYDKPCGLDLLFSAYKALLPQMGGHITGASKFVYNFWVFSYWAKMLGHPRAAQNSHVCVCLCLSIVRKQPGQASGVTCDSKLESCAA